MKVLSIEERIVRSREKTKQLEAEKKVRDKREQEAQRKLDTRRHTIIGKVFSQHFPAVSQFQPRRTEAENEMEFALLDAVLNLIAKDKDYVSQRLDEAKELILGGQEGL